MSYSISINWFEELPKDRWRNVGRELIEENCSHKTQDSGKNKETNLRYSGYCEECDIGESDCNPMMNYGYMLDFEPKDEDVLKVVKETCLTVMQNEDTDEYFLVLCGGGMDLSQNIGLAYIYAQNWIPKDFINKISTQKDLNFGGKKFEFLKEKIIEQLKTYGDSFIKKMEEWSL